jgi:hypothetical protein
MTIYNYNQIPPIDYINTVKAQTIRPIFRITLLNQDETFREDISDYVLVSGSTLSVEYKQGQRRSLTLELDNTSGKFIPNGIMGVIWINTKIKVELGFTMPSGDIVYNPAGVFVVSDPSATRDGVEKTISIQLYDKFALLDGTLGGTLDSTYNIEAGTNVRSIMQATLLQDNGNGYPIDTKPIIFDSLYSNTTTATSISKSPNDSYGDMLIDLANMMSCDIWYDINGNLTIRSGISDISHVNKPTLWEYSDSELEYLTNSTEYDFSKCKNIVTVVGANANNDLIYTGVATNNNAQSPTAVGLIGNKLSYIEDSNIHSDSEALQRAEYELNKVTMLQLVITVDSTYMIHLDVNECISITDSFFNYSADRFIIQSLSIPLSIDSKIAIQCTNIADLPYYEES